MGRSHDCSGPPPVLALPCVSSHSGHQKIPAPEINWELLQELKPDLIFIHDQIGDDARHPSRASREWFLGADQKCRVVSLESHTIEDIFKNLEAIADFCGVQQKGANLVTELRSQWKRIKQKTPQWAEGMPRVSVACLSSVNPLTGAGYWIPEIISCAGGLSLCGRAGCLGDTLTLGGLLQRDPDVIVLLCHGLNTQSLARELAWLEDKGWKQLRAIKANRFFLADVGRFFIDSGPNVVLSAEMMTEILHGFGFGHEGEGFLRWHHHASSQDMGLSENPVNFLQVECRGGRFENAFSLDTLGNEVLQVKEGSHDKHEVFKESSVAQKTHDHPKYVINVREGKRAGLAENDQQQCLYEGKSKPGLWNEDSAYEVVKQSNLLESISYCKESDVIKAETQRSFDANGFRHVTSVIDEAIGPAKEVVCWDEHEAKWRKPMKETHLQKPAVSHLTPDPTEYLNPSHLINQKDRTEEKRPLQVLRSAGEVELSDSHNIVRHLSLDRHVTLVPQKKLTGKGYCQQELISKIWASTESAAAKAKVCHSMPSSSKARAFHKSRSVPVSSAVSVGKNLDSGVPSVQDYEVANKLKSLPRQAAASSNGSRDSKLSLEKPLSAKANRTMSRNSSSISEGGKGSKRQQLPALDRNVGRCSSDKSFKGNCASAGSNSSKIEIILRKAKTIRSLVLTALADIQSANCILLSGGLASSVLAEAAPLVHVGGFKLGITVLTGPAATDRTFAEAVVKRCEMEHAIIGDRDRQSAVALLARELPFVVETLKTFDPVQLRNNVPIAAALREAKSRGFDVVVTGDGTDELFSGGSARITSSIDMQTLHQPITKAIHSSALILGQALGIKVLQPFFHPKIVEHFAIRGEAAKGGRSVLRSAFPDVVAACREKDTIEVGSGMSLISEYFSTAISASVLQSKAKRIYRKERVCIRDAEHLVYYRAFKKVFNGKIPTGMICWGSEPCSGCGYQLSSEMPWYCLVCGQNLNRIDSLPKGKIKPSHEAAQLKLSPSQSSNDNHEYCSYNSKVKVEVGHTGADGDTISNAEASKEKVPGQPKSGQAVNKTIEVQGRHSSRRLGTKKSTHGLSGRHELVPKVSAPENLLDPRRKPEKTTKPKYLLALGAGSAALLLLLQLSRM